MSNNKLNIAKTIRVGFNKRSDTYTGMLAYVIYYDEKNVLRKQPSWESWRDKTIDAQEFPNEPTSGFVLNKKVGDCRSDWNHRMAHIRVYDPRRFEFEISVENLLYILQECTSTKGKGLEGEFVYAWDRSDLILLPVSSVEYQESKVFTDHKLSKVSKNEMVPGCIYLNKDMENVMYLGREDYYEFETNYGDDVTTYSQVNRGKKHVFVYTDNKNAGTYWIQTGFTKIASKISDTVPTSFPEEYEKYKQSFYGSPVTKITFEEREPVIKEYQWWKSLDNGYYPLTTKDGKYYLITDTTVTNNSIKTEYTQEYIIDGCKLSKYNRRDRNRPYYSELAIELQNLKIYEPMAHNEYGKTQKLR